jgi:hypothetical protein
MPKILDRLLKRGTAVTAAIRDRKRTHLESWRQAAADHASGKAVDIVQVEQLAFHLGIQPGDIAADSAAIARRNELQASLARDLTEYDKAVVAWKVAEREIMPARARVASLERDLAMPEALSYGIGAIRREIAEIEEAHPRVFADNANANQGGDAAATGAVADETGAAWMNDDED